MKVIGSDGLDKKFRLSKPKFLQLYLGESGDVNWSAFDGGGFYSQHSLLSKMHWIQQPEFSPLGSQKATLFTSSQVGYLAVFWRQKSFSGSWEFFIGRCEWHASVPTLVAAFNDSPEAFREELGSVKGLGGASAGYLNVC